jgi:hypothetical protein
MAFHAHHALTLIADHNSRHPAFSRRPMDIHSESGRSKRFSRGRPNGFFNPAGFGRHSLPA